MSLVGHELEASDLRLSGLNRMISMWLKIKICHLRRLSFETDKRHIHINNVIGNLSSVGLFSLFFLNVHFVLSSVRFCIVAYRSDKSCSTCMQRQNCRKADVTDAVLMELGLRFEVRGLNGRYQLAERKPMLLPRGAIFGPRLVLQLSRDGATVTVSYRVHCDRTSTGCASTHAR